VGQLSGYKEKETVGLPLGEFLWDVDGNHYLLVADNSVLGLDEVSGELIQRYQMKLTKFSKFYITKQKQRVYLTQFHAPTHEDVQTEESLWNS
jgi:hypothetical protein